MPIDRKTLVDQLVRAATVDKSVPPAWKTDALLWADEQLVAVANNNWPEMVAIATEALAQLEEVASETRILIKLAVLNGRRRDDSENPVAIQCLFDEVKEDIGKLEEGPRKHRCYTFFLYQQEIFGARHGFYAEAAQSAEASAVLHTEPDKKAISAYIAKVYAMWAAIMAGAQEEIDKAFKALKAELPRLQQGVASTALEIQWGNGNGPIHLLQAMILANIQDKTLWDTNMDVVLANADKLGDAFKSGVDILRVAQLCFGHPSTRAVKFANAIVISNNSLATKAWAQLLCARASYSVAVAREHYALVEAVPDAHMVAAVVARELAKFTSKK